MSWWSRDLGMVFLLLLVLRAGPVEAQSGSAEPTGEGMTNRDAVAVIIGNADYAPGIPDVVYARNDAHAMRSFAADVLGVRAGNIINLVDAGQAQMVSVFGNRDDHRGRLWQYVRDGRSDVFVFYSGHGVPGLRDRRGYLLPVDADPTTPELNGYPLDLLLANLEKLGARSVTVAIDACFSGNSAGGWLVSSASPVFVKTAPVTQMKGIVLITAAQSDQVASWDKRSRHGLFTKHFLDAISGAADKPGFGNADGSVTLGEVRDYLDEEMTYAARREFARVQSASVIGPLDRVIVPRIPSRQVTPRPSRTLSPAPDPSVGGDTFPRAADLFRPPKPTDAPSRNRPTTAAEAASFLVGNERDVLLAVRAYYEADGKIWDTVDIGFTRHEPEGLKRLFDTQLIQLIDTGFIFQSRYLFTTSTREVMSEARFKMEFLQDGMAVTRMWR